jgi:hypothetical protein
MPAGRPTTYTKKLGDEICSRIASGESVRSICRESKMPNASTVYLWVIDGKHEEFSNNYERARKAQADHLFEELLEIADDGTNDYMKNKDGVDVLNSEHVQRSRLRLDTRKWYLSKLLPKRFAEKSNIELSGEVAINKTLLEQIIEDEKKKPDLEKEKEKIKARRKK